MQEALRGLLPFYEVCLDSRSLGKLVLSMSSGQPMGSTISGQEDADFETIPEGTATDASMEPELLTERLTTHADAKAP